MKTPAGILSLKPIWSNGTCVYQVTYPSAAISDHFQIERLADRSGYVRSGLMWTPPADGAARVSFSSAISELGLKLHYENDLRFDLQRLMLDAATRTRLESLPDFELFQLYGWAPVQAEGTVDGRYWYFRARGSYWRFELGGNGSGSRSPRWWYEEPWPSATGFEAGYLDDDEAIRCILKAVTEYRAGDHSRFSPDHPDHERTLIDGWSLGALTLRTVTIRLGTSPETVIQRAKELNIEVPWTAPYQLSHLLIIKGNGHTLRRRTKKD